MPGARVGRTRKPRGRDRDEHHPRASPDAGTTCGCRVPLQGEREGTWKVRVWRRPPGSRGTGDLRYFVSVIAEGSAPHAVAFLAASLTGDAVNTTVSLRYRDRTARHADVELSVEAPDGSLGDLVMQHGLTEPDPNAEPIDYSEQRCSNWRRRRAASCRSRERPGRWSSSTTACMTTAR